MLVVAGYLYVAPEDVRRFQAEFQTLAIDTRQREGNFSYDAAIEGPHAGKFILIERWADQTTLNAHLHATDTVQFVDRWQGLIRSDIKKYDASNERDLMAQ